jgi:hypothetical protein
LKRAKFHKKNTKKQAGGMFFPSNQGGHCNDEYSPKKAKQAPYAVVYVEKGEESQKNCLQTVHT